MYFTNFLGGMHAHPKGARCKVYLSESVLQGLSVSARACCKVYPCQRERAARSISLYYTALLWCALLGTVVHLQEMLLLAQFQGVWFCVKISFSCVLVEFLIAVRHSRYMCV